MRKITKWILSLLLMIVVFFVGYYSYNFLQFSHTISSSNQSLFAKQTTNSSAKPKQASTATSLHKPDFRHRINILIMGGDSRGASLYGIQRSDSIMIASLNPKTKQATLMSVLRDTYTSIPGYGMNRINAAFAFGGPQLAVKTISQFLDIPIHYYVYTDFEGFIKLVNALGGIDMNVPKDMHWTDAADGHRFDINLKAGEQHLDGKTALEFVRFRHDNCSDFCRTQRQREFLSALAKKMKSTSALLKLPMILKEISPYVKTNMKLKDMFRVAYLAYQCKTNHIITQQIPPNNLVQEKTVTIDKLPADVIETSPKKVKSYVKQIFIQPVNSTKTSKAKTS